MIGAFTVGKRVLQFQQGVDYIRGESERFYITPEPSPWNGFNATHQLENTVFQNTIRYGVLEKVEVSAVLNYNWNNTYTNTASNADPGLRFNNIKEADFQNIDLGLRFNLLDGANRAKLAWGLQIRTGFYQWMANPNVKGSDLKIVSALGRNFSKYHSFRLNAGTIIREFETASLKYDLNYVFRPIPKFGVTMEYSGVAYFNSNATNNFSHQYLAAIHYLICDDVQVDLRGGLNDNIAVAFVPKTWFMGAGISWRVRTTKR